MYKITLDCEVITPLFMYGADGRTPEIRPSEIKGMMRWWWRAIRAENDIQKLKDIEEEIFGGTEKGGRSKVVVRVEPQGIQGRGYSPLPHKDGFRRIPKNSIYPGSRFKVTLVAFESKISEIAKDLFYLSTKLGGFGFRSRRGFGCVEIVGIDGHYSRTQPEYEQEGVNVQEYRNISSFKSIFSGVNEDRIEKLKRILPSNDLLRFYKHLLRLLNNVSKDNKYSICSLGSYLILNTQSGGINSRYPWIKAIILSKCGADKYNELLRVIGQATSLHNPSSNRQDFSLGKANPRFASPVYVSVVKIEEKFHPIFTILNCSPRESNMNCSINKQIDFIVDICKAVCNTSQTGGTRKS